MLLKRKFIGSCQPMIGVPSVQSEFTWAWGAFREWNARYVCGPNEDIFYDRPYQSFHAHARNRAVSLMKGDWLFQLDCDHTFDPDLLQRMLRSAAEINAPVLTGLYTSRNPPYGPIVFGEKDGENFIISHILPREDGTPAPPVTRVFGAGAGCLLVQRWVFERIWNEMRQAPFAPIPTDPKRTTMEEGCYSEDRSFFWRCAALSIPVFVDWRIECHHLRTTAQSYSDFRKDLVRPWVIKPSTNGQNGATVDPSTVDDAKPETVEVMA